ncbi:MAG: amino acid ABC transporter permease [Actinomycetota bacterium]|nr:amino acid ABC transporter permease [Actinomycetota bacterium]
MKNRRERFREWFGELTTPAMGVLSIGAAALFVVVVVSFVYLWIEGLTPAAELAETMVSTNAGTILYTGGALGILATAAGFLTYKRMPTKAAKEAAVSGAALGVQAVLLAGLFLWFRSGEKFDIFVRQFLSFDVLGPFMDQFLNAAKNTILLAVSGQAIGMVLGLVLSLLVLSNRVVVRAPARFYINVVRGTPLLVQLSIGYLGLITGLGLDVSAYRAAAFILGLNAGAYTAEIFRSGIQSLERGQLEAARSLGMSYLQAMGYVIIPQAVRRVIPPLTNEFVILIKDTSLVAFLGLTFAQRELLAWGRDTYAELFNSTPFLVAAVGYLIVTLPLIRFVTFLETRLRSGLVGIGA